MHGRVRHFARFSVSVVVAAFLAAGCAHYPVNQPLEQVDQLRDVAHRILDQSEEFQRLLGDLN